ncbi:hypothetical protein ACFQX6_15185 [Streptosporangium lutulentum]
MTVYLLCSMTTASSFLIRALCLQTGRRAGAAVCVAAVSGTQRGPRLTREQERAGPRITYT